MSLYPNLGEEIPVRRDEQDESEDVTIVLQIPAGSVEVTFVRSNAPIATDFPTISIEDSHLGPVLKFNSQRIVLDQSIFVLHYDLEMYCIGGRQGPIDGTDYHLLLKLINPSEDLIVSTTCIFMNNARYKCLFSEEQIGTHSNEPVDIGDKVSAGILYAADGLSKGISWAGDKSKSLMEGKAQNYVETTPALSNPKEVSPGWKKTAEVASVGTKYVAKGTGYLASAIGQVATYAGGKIADKVQEKYGAKDEKGETSSTWRNTTKIIGGALAGYGKVWEALEHSGKKIAVASRDSTAKVVTHRSGAAAGEVTYNSMNVGVNLTKTFFHIEDMGMKKICKTVGKSAAKNYLQKHLDAKKARENQQKQVQPNQPMAIMQ